MVVSIRVVLPWPLRAMAEPWLAGGEGASVAAGSILPATVDPIMVMGGVFLVLLVGLGLCDYLERLYFARFSIGLVRDLRADVFKAAVRGGSFRRSMGSGDLVARLIGDTARVKAGLKGFLVHVATNGVMYAGVTGVLIWMNTGLGLIFAAAGVTVGMITWRGATRMYKAATRFRRKEGRLADTIEQAWSENHDGVSFAALNRSSGQHEASLTQIQGSTTWLAHIVLAVAVVAALWVGMRAVSQGQLSTGDVLIVAMYALMMRAPIVQLARQGSRTGKILACADRLSRILTTSQQATVVAAGLEPNPQQIELVGVSLRTGSRRQRRRRLGPIDLTIRRGTHLAILGSAGCGKTTLLEVLAGLLAPTRGKILWNKQDVTDGEVSAFSQFVTYVPQNPTWSQRPIRELLRIDTQTIDATTEKQLRACRAAAAIKKLPNGLDTVIGSDALSFAQRKAIAVASGLRSNADVRLFDDPAGMLPKKNARKMIRAILRTRPEGTVVVALGRPVKLREFDRVIQLSKGEIVFDGSAAGWREFSAERDRARKSRKEGTAQETAFSEGMQ